MDTKNLNEINKELVNRFIDRDLEQKIKNDPELINNKNIDIDQLVIDASEMSRAMHLKDVNSAKILDAIGESIIVEEEQSDGTIIRKYESIIPDLEEGVTGFRNSNSSISDMLQKVIDLERTEAMIEEIDRIDMYNQRYSSNVDLLLKYDKNGGIAVPKLNVDFLDENGIEVLSNGFEDDQTIVVGDEEQKEEIIEYVGNEIKNGKFNLIKFNKPLSVSGLRIHRKLKSIKQKFTDTYGSEVLRKVSEMILQEESLYQNLDRIKRIEQYKKNKMKLEKKYRLRSKIKNILGVK